MSNNESNNEGPFLSGRMLTIHVRYLAGWDDVTGAQFNPEIELWSNLNEKDLTRWSATQFYPDKVHSGGGSYMASMTVWIAPVDEPTEYSYTVRGRDSENDEWVWLSSFRNPANNIISVVPPALVNPPARKRWFSWRKNRKSTQVQA